MRRRELSEGIGGCVAARREKCGPTHSQGRNVMVQWMQF
jgi:hypothetical protein